MLLIANPYTTKNSLFANITPIKPPESIEGVTSLPMFFVIVQVILLIAVALLFINWILHLFGVNIFKLFSGLTLKTRRSKLFGKKVGESELVDTLLKVLEVLRDQIDFSNKDTMNKLNDVVYKVETVLTILEKQDKDSEADVFNFLDISLSHEKYLMLKLVNYLDNNRRVKERIVEESLEAINEGLERVLDEYINQTAKSVEDELMIYNELREQQKERDYADLMRRD